jgi:release factor glutamine methyltransferase
VAYILGEREFWSMTFKVDQRVLVPRPETEHLVEAVLDYVASCALAQPRIADIGTGSGNIACALAKSLPTATIWASDVSQAALDLAEENARILGFSERIEFVAGDCIEPLRERGAFDVLVSNPPYVAPGEWREVPDSIRSYEPEVALLDREPDGLGCVGRVFRDGVSILARPGAVACEIGAAQAEGAVAAARAAGYGEVSLRKDLAGHRRVIVAVAG